MATKRAATTKKKATKPAPKRPGITRLGALRVAAPEQWEREVRLAMRATGGRVPDAAEALEVSARTLFVWLEDPRFADVDRAPTGAPPRKS